MIKRFYSLVLCTLMSLLAMSSAIAQTTIISATGDGGFENGATFASNGWTLVNNTATTAANWYVGSVPVSAAGTNAAYIDTAGGTTWGYKTSTPSTVHFYRDVTVAANHPKIELNFSWKGKGESGYDRLLVYTAPTTVTPTAGVPASSSTALTGATLVFTGTSQTTVAYVNSQVFLPASLAGTTFRLIFVWQSDISGGTMPPVAIDDISLVSNVALDFTSVASGNWGTASTWDRNAVPFPFDNVTIASGHAVSLAAAAGTVQVNNITISGTLGFPSTATSPLVASTQLIGNNITINTGGTLNAFSATTATTPVYTGRTVTVLGDFTNNGSADFSRGNTTNSILQFQGSPTLLGGSATQTLSGTGTFVNDAIRDLRFWSATSLTLARQVNVSSRVYHGQGDVINLNNLTLDNTLGAASGTAQNGVMYTKSLALAPYVSSNTFNTATLASLFLELTSFTAGGAVPANQVPIAIYNVGAELPSSRTLAGLRVNNISGKVLLGAGNVTLTSASNSTTASTPFYGSTFPPSLILSAGIVELNPGNEIYLNNPLLATLSTGSTTAFVDGKLRILVTSTTAVSRNFPVGKVSRPGNVVVGGLTGTAITVAVEPSTAPSGSAAAPLTSVLGVRSYRVQSSSALPATATVAASWNSDDQLNFGTNPQLYLAQSPDISGSTALWTSRSATSTTTGAIAATGSRASTAGISLANGEYFAFATSMPSTPDVALLEGSPQTDVLCIDGTDVITSSVKNLNFEPIDFAVTPMTVAYTVNGVTTTSTVNTGTLAPLATLTNTSGNLNLSGAAKNIKVKATLTGSTVLSNDSAVTVFQDRNAFLDFGSTKTLPIGTNVQANLKFYQGLRITEALKNYGGTGTGVLPSYLPATAGDLIEVSNLGKMTIDLNPIVLEVFGSGARTWSFPAGATLAPGEVAVVHLGTGTDVPASRFYNTGGSNDVILSSSAFGVMLRDSATSYVIDLVAERGSPTGTILLPSGTPAASWNGNIGGSGSGLAGMRLSNSNWLIQGSAWIRSSTLEPLTIGVLNPGLAASTTAGAISWSAPFTGTSLSVSSGAINTPGPLVVTATVSGGSCTDVISDTITILPPPVPIVAFGPNTQDVLSGLYNKSTVVTFTDSTVNFPTGWAWSFSPNTVTYVQGTSATSQNPKVVFNNPGTYQAQLIASNVTGSDTLVEPITVLPGQAVRVFMRTDRYADEVIYRFKDVTTNKVWVQRGPFAQVNPWSAAAATRIDTVLIPQTTNAYEFRFIDTYGNGLVDGANPDGIFEASLICNWGNPVILSGGGASAYGSVATAPSYDSVVFSINCRQPATYLLKVNMSQQTVGANGVHVAGNFQGWNPGTSAMTDANGDGIYEYTVMTYVGDTLKYKFINGNALANNEVLSAATGTCVVSDGNGNFNRQKAITMVADSAAVVCWSSCLGCFAIPPPTTIQNIVYCQGSVAAQLTATGLPGAFILWFDGQMTPLTQAPIPSTLASGTTTYYVGQLTLSGQGAIIPIDVTIKPLPVVNAGTDVTVCLGTPVALSGSGASTYSWNNAITNATAFTPTATTTYTVTGTDADGCVNTDQVVVTVKPLPVVSAGADVTVCAGTAVTLSGTGALTYTWNNAITNATAFTPAATTTYTVTGTDANGCVNTDQVVVTVNPLPVVSAGADLTVCAGTAVTLSGTGALTYTWNNSVSNGVSFTPTATATYTVTVTNANGCVNTDQVTVTVNALPTLGAGADVTVCAGTPVTLSGSGASTYTWNNSVSNGVAFIPTATTTYTVTGTNANGCVNTDQVVVTVNPLPVVSAGADVTVCAGTPVTLSGSGASTYTWNNAITNATAFTPTATTTYTVTGTDANGCVNTDQVVVTVNTLPTVGAGADLTVCAGTAVTLSGTGALTYTWNNSVSNGVSFTPTATTTYTVTGTDANGCVNTDQVVITVNPLPVVSAGADLTVCAGTAVTLSGTGASTYSWDNSVSNAVAFTPTATTTYTVTGTDANGCVNTDQVVVTVNPLPVVNAGTDVTVCAGTPVTLSGSGALTYSWNNAITNATAFTPAATTTYTVTGTDANGCVNTDQVVVTVNPLPVVSAGADLTVCAGTAVTLSGTGALTYTWNNSVSNGVSFTPTATATYTVTGTDANGCVNVDSVNVSVVPAIVLPQILGDLYGWFASGATVNFSVMNTGGYTLNWGITGGVITGGQGGDTISVVWGAAASTAAIWVVVSNGVCQDSAYLNLVISGLGTGEGAGAKAMAYPNPNSGVFTLEWSNIDAQQVLIYNGVGQVVASQPIDQGSTSAVIDLSTKAAGIYRAVIYGIEGTVTLPVYVRH